ncbi:2-nitroimidazole transporter [Lentibacillus sp. JNUCC-1]|nr:2-nitroimidazole transporter [Lentibacillus sp. JNUCC-1]
MLLALGIVIRTIAHPVLLFGGTLMIGIGIAVSNVLLPGIIKERFPKRETLMTSIYATSMSLSAALASGLSIPIAEHSAYGWQAALAVWAIPAIIAALMWIYFVRHRTSANKVRMEFVYASDMRMWRSRLAWQVAVFMGMQAFVYNVIITWLPEMLRDYGVTSSEAGWMLSVNQFVGLPIGLIVPILAGKMASQRLIVSILCVLSFIGLGGLFYGDSYTMMVISVLLIGVALGGLFPLALTFLGLRAYTAKQAAELSGMAQAIGYFLAATGPILMGYVIDATGNWSAALLILMFMTLLTWVVGLGAGRNRVVSDDFSG